MFSENINTYVTALLPTAFRPTNIMSTVLTMMKMVGGMPVEFDVGW